MFILTQIKYNCPVAGGFLANSIPAWFISYKLHHIMAAVNQALRKEVISIYKGILYFDLYKHHFLTPLQSFYTLVENIPWDMITSSRDCTRRSSAMLA
jgi:hypothetical protein